MAKKTARASKKQASPRNSGDLILDKRDFLINNLSFEWDDTYKIYRHFPSGVGISRDLLTDITEDLEGFQIRVRKLVKVK